MKADNRLQVKSKKILKEKTVLDAKTHTRLDFDFGVAPDEAFVRSKSAKLTYIV